MAHREQRHPALRIVAGLGANLGDRLGGLRGAARALDELRATTVIARSRVYESAPAGGPPQPDYLNAATLLSTHLTPRELLDEILQIERQLGRQRPDPVRWGPRPIDIDLLWGSGLQIDEPGLTVPHPRLAERPFALQPLLDVAPEATDPHTGTPYADLPAAAVALDCCGELEA